MSSLHAKAETDKEMRADERCRGTDDTEGKRTRFRQNVTTREYV